MKPDTESGWAGWAGHVESDSDAMTAEEGMCCMPMTREGGASD